jgi:hypothetical protein
MALGPLNSLIFIYQRQPKGFVVVVVVVVVVVFVVFVIVIVVAIAVFSYLA